MTRKTTGWRARALARTILAALLAAQAVTAVPRLSIADEDAAAFRDLATAGDFRLRVIAALALGKSKSSGARPALERALGDPHPAVRSAAAAALGALGDAAALPALRAALAAEATPGVKAQIEQTIQRLSSSASPSRPAGKAKFLVSVGKVENKSSVSDSTIPGTLRGAARSRIAAVPGVELLAEGADASAEGKSRGLPTFTLDSSLTQLAKRTGRDGIGYSARVEFVIRRMPDQVLKGTMAGTAQALADAAQVRGQNELVQLQNDAIGAAVDTALQSAGKTLEAAAH